MDLLTELLPPSHLVNKAENTAKDRKQKGKQYSFVKNAYASERQSDSENLIDFTRVSNWDEVERRSGKDRREYMESRGRWLESRAEKDRRQLAKAIQIKI